MRDATARKRAAFLPVVPRLASGVHDACHFVGGGPFDSGVDRSMSRFTSLLKVAPLPDGRSWVLLEPLTYECNHGTNDRITVPAGFVTDFASIPRPLWWWFSPWGQHGNAAVVHDFLYWSRLRTRAEADRIFLDGMDVLGTLLTTRYLMYAAVRVFGRCAWWTNEHERKAGRNRILTTLPTTTDEVPRRGLDLIFRKWLKRKAA